MVDEMTDKGTEEAMTINIQFYNWESRKVETAMWDMVNVHTKRVIDSSADAKNLCELIIKS